MAGRVCDWNRPRDTGLHMGLGGGLHGAHSAQPDTIFHSKEELLGICLPEPRPVGGWALSASLAARQARKEPLMAEVGQATPNSPVIQG